MLNFRLFLKLTRSVTSLPTNMEHNQKLVSEFMKLGNVSKKDANVGLQVYLELCEVRKYWDVVAKYNPEAQLLYFTAKKSKSESDSIFVPRAASDGLSFNQMQSYFKLCDANDRSIYLGLVSADSTCVFYKLGEGLQMPADVSANKHSTEKLEAEISKNRGVIAEAALCGIPVTLRESTN